MHPMEPQDQYRCLPADVARLHPVLLDWAYI